MSIQEAAGLYEDVINDVISDSRQDFEDSGIDEQTLQDLKTLWQENLAQARVANLPWSPLGPPSHLLGPSDGSVSEQKLKQEAGSVNSFEFQATDENGEMTKSLQKQREAELKKERSLAALDSDDINSDLDDSDDDDQAFDEDADEADGMIILCLYDKVLRVKNKWKCNLKDGIANVNGRDYAFAKATGESEW